MSASRSQAGAWERLDHPSAVQVFNPKLFIRQYLAPLFIGGTESANAYAVDRTIGHEVEFWETAQDDLFEVVNLSQFIVTDWFPRAPGIFWTNTAKRARDLVFQDGVESDPQLGQFYKPTSKVALIEQGGLGTIRLRPRTIDGVDCWLATALKDRFCHAGIPLAVPELLIRNAGIRWGDVVDIVGRVRFLHDAGLTEIADAVHDTRPLIVFVDKILKWRVPNLHNTVAITPVVLFGPARQQPDERRAWYNRTPGFTFVHCPAGDDKTVLRAAAWMEKYAARYHGTVLTNFDEQLPRVANAPLSYQRLVTNSFDHKVIRQYVDNRTIARIENLACVERVTMEHTSLLVVMQSSISMRRLTRSHKP